MSGAVVKAMRDCPMPIVAAVNGVAAGAGAVLALAADLRLLAQLGEVLVPLHEGRPGRRGHGRRLPPPPPGRARPRDRAADPRRRGRPPTRATAIGLATRVVADEELPAATEELARQLADGPALAYATTKILLTRELDLDLGGAIEMEALAQALLMKSDDFGEFYAAWSEGRSPAWTRSSMIVNPPELPEPVGYAHAVVAAPDGRLPRRADRGGRDAGRAVRLGRRRSSSRPCARPAASPTTSSRSSSTRPTIDEYRASMRRAGRGLAPPLRPALPRDGARRRLGAVGARRAGRADGRRGVPGWLTLLERRAGSATSGSRRSRQRASPDAWTGRS